jgi:hypothetical protein
MKIQYLGGQEMLMEFSKKIDKKILYTTMLKQTELQKENIKTDKMFMNKYIKLLWE